MNSDSNIPYFTNILVDESNIDDDFLARDYVYGSQIPNELQMSSENPIEVQLMKGRSQCTKNFSFDEDKLLCAA